MAIPLPQTLDAHYFEEQLVALHLGRAYAEQLSLGRLPDKILRPYAFALQEISDEYIKHGRTPRSISELHTRAYALYHGQLSFFKFGLLFQRCGIEAPKSILDFGCGPGSGAAAALAIASLHAEVTLLDRAGPMLESASALINRLCDSTIPAKVSSESLGALSSERFDLICAGNVLSEMPPYEALECCMSLFDLLSEQGTLCIIEPGTPRAARQLMEIRDSFLKVARGVQILYPCTHHNACPMRLLEHEWCHTWEHWQRPTTIEQLDELTGFNKHRIKFFPLLLRRGAHEQGALRVVKECVRVPAGHRAWLCGKDYFGEALLKNSDRDDNTRRFTKLSQYERVDVTPTLLEREVPAGAMVSVLPG